MCIRDSTGNALGEKNARKLDMVGRSTIVVTLIMMSITGGLLFLFAPQVMGIFSPDARVVAQGTAILRLVALSEPIFGIAIGVEGMLQGAGDTMVPFVITTGTMWMVRILGTVLVPVSYTHLDVYKRQRQINRGNSGDF